MRAHKIPIDLRLQDGWIEFVVVQWRTPRPDDFEPIPNEWVVGKKELINSLALYLQSNPTSRLRIVVFPEISLPESLVTTVKTSIVEVSDNPTVVIAGLEHLNSERHYALLSETCGHMPELEYDPDEDTRFFNDALIVIGSSAEEVRFFVQPKRLPWHEERRLNLCKDVIVFADETSPVKFRFCVQLCSDFNSEAHVAEMKKAIRDCGVDSLDMIVLIEFNPVQFNSPGFRENLRLSLREYFSVGAGDGVETRRGFVLAANRARDTVVSNEFGGSCLAFKHGAWEHESIWSLPSSYFFNDDSGYSLQRVHFRVETPAVHRFEYRARCLADEEPGGEQQSPFRNSLVRTARIDDSLPEQQTLNDFTEIHPFAVCITKVMQECAKSLCAELRDGVEPDIASLYESEAKASIECIDQETKKGTEKASKAFSTYFLCEANSPGYPPTSCDPDLWKDRTREAIAQLARAHSLLRLGLQEGCYGDLTMLFSALAHATIGERELVVYLWSADHLASAPVVKWLHRARASMHLTPTLIVAVKPGSLLDAATVKRLATSVTNVEECYQGGSTGVERGGEVVSAVPLKNLLSALDTVRLETEVCSADDVADLKRRLALLISEPMGALRT